MGKEAIARYVGATVDEREGVGGREGSCYTIPFPDSLWPFPLLVNYCVGLGDAVRKNRGIVVPWLRLGDPHPGQECVCVCVCVCACAYASVFVCACVCVCVCE